MKNLLRFHHLIAKMRAIFLLCVRETSNLSMKEKRKVIEEDEEEILDKKDQSGIFNGSRKVEFSFVGRANNDA